VLSARLIQLIETHSEVLTREVLQDLATNPRTRSFQMVLRVPLVAHRQPLPKSRRVGSDWARTYMIRENRDEWLPSRTAWRTRERMRR
jgi:hypothetical protein